MFEDLLVRFLTPEMVATVLAAIFAFLVRKKWIKEDHATKLDQIVTGSVTAVYHEYVQEIKAGGNKMTDEQKKEARARAIAKIKSESVSAGIDLVKEFGIDYVVSLIERKVQGK